MNCKDFLMRLSGAVGVSGRESSVVALAAEELRALGEVSISPLGDLICTIRRPEEGQKNFMLDAHVDEIGMIVTWIDDEGFLKVSPVGGFDRSLLLASQVSVHTKQGDLPGVICSIPPHLQSGEATSRAMIDVPEIQMELFHKVLAVNPNVVVVLFNGRPLDLREISAKAKAVLEVWFPGTEGGSAVVDVLTGKKNPSGHLPMSFPYCVGQAPVSYNEYSTGRPNLPGMKERFRSKYLDIPNAPLYPFGYGLSYTTFDISAVTLDQNEMDKNGRIAAHVTVKNTGDTAGCDVVQLYIRDDYSDVVRPVRELKGFRRVELAPGKEQEVTFYITEEDLRYYRLDGTFGSEPGTFTVFVGDSSTTENSAVFTLK